MNHPIALSALLSISALISISATASPTSVCEYFGSRKGEVLQYYVLESGVEAASWEPTNLALCADSEGRFVISTYRAPGLGRISDLPLPVIARYSDQPTEDSSVYLYGVGEEEVLAYFGEYSKVQVIVVAPTDGHSVKVYRRQLSRIVSSTLVESL